MWELFVHTCKIQSTRHRPHVILQIVRHIWAIIVCLFLPSAAEPQNRPPSSPNEDDILPQQHPSRPSNQLHKRPTSGSNRHNNSSTHWNKLNQIVHSSSSVLFSSASPLIACHLRRGTGDHLTDKHISWTNLSIFAHIFSPVFYIFSPSVSHSNATDNMCICKQGRVLTLKHLKWE